MAYTRIMIVAGISWFLPGCSSMVNNSMNSGYIVLLWDATAVCVATVHFSLLGRLIINSYIHNSEMIIKELKIFF